MIVSHSRKLILIKTRKTAGTSMEIALSAHCGPRDIITPIEAADEELRRSLTDVGPQNHRIPLHRVRRAELRRARRLRQWPCYFNHFPGERLRRHLGEAVWDDYFSFAFERNPWDKVVSLFAFYNPDDDGSGFSAWLHRVPASRLTNDPIYGDGTAPLVDYVGRYEDGVQEQVDAIFADVGIPAAPLPRAKGGVRKRAWSDWRSLYSDDDAAYVARVCATEIERFHYTFDGCR